MENAANRRAAERHLVGNIAVLVLGVALLLEGIILVAEFHSSYGILAIILSFFIIMAGTGAPPLRLPGRWRR